MATSCTVVAVHKCILPLLIPSPFIVRLLNIYTSQAAINMPFPWGRYDDRTIHRVDKRAVHLELPPALIVANLTLPLIRTVLVAKATLVALFARIIVILVVIRRVPLVVEVVLLGPS